MRGFLKIREIKMGLLNLFKKKKQVLDKKIYDKIDENLNYSNIKDVEIEFLKKLNGYIVNNDYPKYWDDYINDIDRFIKKLIQSSLLRISTPKDDIKSLKVKQLKELLSQKLLDCKGKKDELIQIVLDNYNDDELKDIIEWKEQYILTKEGKEIVEAYTSNKDKIYINLTIEVFNLVKDIKINEAYIKIAKFEQNQVFKRGISIDWSKEAESGMSNNEIKSYESIIKSETKNTDLVIASICGILLGENPKKVAKIYSDYLSNISDIEDEINYTQSLIRSKKEISEYKGVSSGKYQILGVLDKKSCEKCGSLDGKVFSYKEKKIGVNYPPFCKKCRCITVPYIEADIISERAARNPETGKTFYVPSNMTYIDYKKVFIDKEISLQEWISINEANQI